MAGKEDQHLALFLQQPRVVGSEGDDTGDHGIRRAQQRLRHPGTNGLTFGAHRYLIDDFCHPLDGDQDCGFGAAELGFRLAGALDGAPGADASDDRQHGEQGGNGGIAAGARPGAGDLAVLQLAEAKAEDAGDHLQRAVVPAVALRAQVGGERQATLALTQRCREGLRRLAVDQGGVNALAAAGAAEHPDFFVHPAAGRRRRTAHHHQVVRGGEGALQPPRQCRRGGQLLAVAKHRIEPGRHRPERRLAADQRLRRAVAVEVLEQPVAGCPVTVRIADEGAIAPRLCPRHRDFPPSLGTIVPDLRRPGINRECEALAVYPPDLWRSVLLFHRGMARGHMFARAAGCGGWNGALRFAQHHPTPPLRP